MSGILTARRGRLTPPPAAAGAVNVITNGNFSADDAGWGGFWYSGKTASGGKAHFTASPAYDGVTQTVSLTGGKYYEVTLTISSRTSGNLFCQIFGGGGAVTSGTVRSADGTYTERLLANTGNNTFQFTMETGGTLDVDDITLIGPYNTATVGGA